MAKPLSAWLEEDVEQVKDKPLGWLSQEFFFRDPPRGTFSDPSYFFSPADGIILYQREVEPDAAILDIKGRPYSLRDAMRDATYDKRSLVVGIFMTFYDVHVNRIPYPGRLSYRLLEAIDTINHPMLDVEKAILEQLHLPPAEVEYLRHNQRVLNRVDSAHLDDPYYVLQIADYDVDSITPFELRQQQPCAQGRRFSQIRYGSQVDLIVPLSPKYELVCLHDDATHVEAGVDPLIRIDWTESDPERDS
jgi:phosphatidylserine decarboxylase